MNIIEFEIPGEPTSKCRPRVTKWGTFNTEQTINYENLIKVMYKEKYRDFQLKGFLRCEITAYFSIPKSKSKKVKEQMMQGIIRPKGKDLDNICKIVMDGLNKIAYEDDRNIVELTARKYYAEIPKVLVKIEELEV
jgi:Holliday junction resolvase RusA-like endonuclease